jgi:phosphorylcholine metabolism protein LicD
MYEKLKKVASNNLVLSFLLKPVYSMTLAKIHQRKKQKLLTENSIEVFVAFDNALKELNKPYWLEFGTLLGAVREGGVISHDTDIDMGMFLSDYDESVPEVLRKYGFERQYILKSETVSEAFEETYLYKGIGVDIFYFIKGENEISCYDFMREDNYTREITIAKFGGLKLRRIPLAFKKLNTIRLSDIELPVPEPVDKHLISHYGNNYLKKDITWTSGKNAASAIYIDHSGRVVTDV